MRPTGLFIAVLAWLVLPSASPAQELRERAAFRAGPLPVDRMALGPHAKVLAAGGGDPRGGWLKLYDAAVGKEIAPLVGQAGTLHALAFSADGKRLVTAGPGMVQVWNVPLRRHITTIPLVGREAAVLALNRNGKAVAAVCGRQVKLWEVAGGKELIAFRHHVPLDGTAGAAFSADLQTVAVRDHQEIDLYDATTGKVQVTLAEHRGEVGCLLWSAGGQTLIAASTLRRAKDAGYEGDVKIWDVATGQERTSLPGPFGSVTAMALSPDGGTLALLDAPEPYTPADLKLVDMATGRQRVLRAPAGCTFRALGFTREGTLRVAGTSGATLRLWEAASPKESGRR